MTDNTRMPLEMVPDREAFEKEGFVFGDIIDNIFIAATLPPGWTRRGTDDAMWSDIIDEPGRRRVEIFYKATLHGRRATAYLLAATAPKAD